MQRLRQIKLEEERYGVEDRNKERKIEKGRGEKQKDKERERERERAGWGRERVGGGGKRGGGVDLDKQTQAKSPGDAYGQRQVQGLQMDKKALQATVLERETSEFFIDHESNTGY